MSENTFLENTKKDQGEFLRALLSLLICAFVLIFSSNIAPQIYISQTKQAHFEMKDLIHFFGRNVFFLLQLIPFALSLLSLMLCYKYIHKRSVLSLFTSRKRIDFKRFFLSFFVWFGILALVLFLNFFRKSLPISWNFSPAFFTLLSFSLVLVAIQTTFEEVLFRSFLLKNFYNATKSKLIALLATSALFGLMHLNNPEVGLIGKWILLYFIGTGIFLGLLAICDKGLELSMGFHAANNLFATLILTNNWQVFQTDALFKDYSAPSLTWDTWIYLFIIFPLLIFFYGKIYKWDFGAIIAKFTGK